MAVSFRHGSNGAYKSAYAVWFEIVPALRSGRLVITNVEGLKSLEGIEKALGEKFPESARLIRIFSRSEEGVHLWQNWFSWAPIGALLIIDECQDLFTADVGFKREKALYKPVEQFLQYLPSDFSELFYSRWLPVPEEARNNDGEEDDTGRTQYDESGRLLYPYNFYGAFMRHRKYQWDIILLTPDWTSIPTWLRGCAQSAFSHASKDSFLSRRRPRIYHHSPQSSKSQPSTKQDFASCTNVKIPIDVFALYKSTGTGGFNESKADLTVLRSPKFLLSLLIGVGSLGYFMVKGYEVYFRSDNDKAAQVVAVDNDGSGSSSGTQNAGNNLSSTQANNSSGGSVASVRASGQGGVSDSGGFYSGVNPFSHVFPDFNDAKAVYITYRQKFIVDGVESVTYGVRLDIADVSYYLRSEMLNKYGYRFLPIDDCLVKVVYHTESSMLTCPPYSSDVPIMLDNSATLVNRQADVQKSVDLFNL